MKTMLKKNLGALLLVLTATFSGCQKDETITSKGNSEISVRMTDAPAVYAAVNIDIKAVEILYRDSTTYNCQDTLGSKVDTTDNHCGCEEKSEDQKWIRLTTMAGVYNLLEFQNGLDTVIAEGQIQAGHILKMRLILGENNSIVVGTDTIPLKVPSGMEAGLKLIIDKPATPNGKLNILFDFDADASVVVTGHNSFILKPVLKFKMSS